MPRVATSAKPIATSFRQGSITACLSCRAPRRRPGLGAAARCRCRAATWRRRGRNPKSRPITSPVDFISGPRMRSTPGKRAKGKTASLTATCGRARFGLEPEVGELLARHHPRGDLGDRHAGRLGDEGHGARGARIDLEHIDVAVLDRELHVHQPDDAERARERRGLPLDLGDDRRATASRAAASRRCRPNECRPPRYAP